MPEVGVGGPGGQYEVVIGKTGAAGKADDLGLGVDGNHRIHQDFSVLLVAQDTADGLGDVGGRQDRQRDLVEQRLEGVMIFAIDEGDIDGQVSERYGCVKAAKTSAHDHDTRPASGRFPQWLSQLAQVCLALIEEMRWNAQRSQRDAVLVEACAAGGRRWKAISPGSWAGNGILPAP